MPLVQFKRGFICKGVVEVAFGAMAPHIAKSSPLVVCLSPRTQPMLGDPVDLCSVDFRGVSKFGAFILQDYYIVFEMIYITKIALNLW